MFVFGLHIVGDYASGQLWTQSIANLTDAGTAVRRLRRAPVVSKEDEWIFFKWLRLLLTLGTVTAGATPMITLRVSNDGGVTFGSDRTVPLGLTGVNAAKVEWRRLGRSKRRVYEVIIEEPFFVSFTNAFLGYGK